MNGDNYITKIALAGTLNDWNEIVKKMETSSLSHIRADFPDFSELINPVASDLFEQKVELLSKIGCSQLKYTTRLSSEFIGNIDGLQKNAVSISAVAMQSMTKMMSDNLNEILRNLYCKIPQFDVPRLSPKTENRRKFIDIVAHCNMPVYFETDTELQDLILDICQNSEEKYPKHEVENCVMDYYTADRLEDLLQYWFSKKWIEPEHKNALKEAVKLYELGFYWGCSCILLSQVNGLITELYDATNVKTKMPKTEQMKLLRVYNIENPTSEKAKGILMIGMQQNGIYGWYKFAKYFKDFTYSNKKNKAHYQFDPGRNRCCHGKQLNLGEKLIALKSILTIDVVIQMSEDLLNDDVA